MRLFFRSNALQKGYEEADYGIRRWGPQVARKYVQRIEALYAAQNFDEIKRIRAFRTHELEGERKGEWAITLTQRARLIVSPSEDGKTVTVEEVSQHYGD